MEDLTVELEFKVTRGFELITQRSKRIIARLGKNPFKIYFTRHSVVAEGYFGKVEMKKELQIEQLYKLCLTCNSYMVRLEVYEVDGGWMD